MQYYNGYFQGVTELRQLRLLTSEHLRVLIDWCYSRQICLSICCLWYAEVQQKAESKPDASVVDFMNWIFMNWNNILFLRFLITSFQSDINPLRGANWWHKALNHGWEHLTGRKPTMSVTHFKLYNQGITSNITTTTLLKSFYLYNRINLLQQFFLICLRRNWL